MATTFADPSAAGYTHTPALDRLTAIALLRQSQIDLAYTSLLFDTARVLWPVASRMPPHQRVEWALKGQGIFANNDDIEGALAKLALLWLARAEQEAVAKTLADEGEHTSQSSPKPLLEPPIDWPHLGMPRAPWYEVTTPEEQSQIAQCCAWIEATLQRQPSSRIAIALTDSLAVRRVLGTLQAKGRLEGVEVVDDFGWSLATSHSAARLMRLLEEDAKGGGKGGRGRAVAGISQPRPRSLHGHLKRLWGLLQTRGDWEDFVVRDRVAQRILQVLHLGTMEALPDMPLGHRAFVQWVRLVLEDSRFRPYDLPYDSPPEAMKGASGERSQIHLCSLESLSAYPHFDLCLIPSCDATHLPLYSPAHQGVYFSDAQRLALGLPTRQQHLHQQQQRMRRLLYLTTPLLWVHSQTMEGQDAAHSPWLELWRVLGFLRPLPTHLQNRQGPEALEQRQDQCDDARVSSDRAAAASRDRGVRIDWQTMAPRHLSASGYADLKSCHYKFYAQRVLGLKAPPDLLEQVDKRDWGNWLHRTLEIFHASAVEASLALAQMRQGLQAAAAQATAELRLDEAAFLPYQLAWDATRESYLAWLMQHQREGWCVREVEHWHERSLDIEGVGIRLLGKLDRMDAKQLPTEKGFSAAPRLLIDYKTESLGKTKKRINSPQDDTQLIFYAALLEATDTDSAGYLHLPERYDSQRQAALLPLEDIATHASTLLLDLQQTLRQMAAAQPLRATPQEEVCRYCEARGLCRKDFWEPVQP